MRQSVVACGAVGAGTDTDDDISSSVIVFICAVIFVLNGGVGVPDGLYACACCACGAAVPVFVCTHKYCVLRCGPVGGGWCGRVVGAVCV